MPCNRLPGIGGNYRRKGKKEREQTLEETNGYVRPMGSTSGPTAWQLQVDDYNEVEETEGYARDENVCNITVDGPKENITEILTRKQEENI